jgi:hypothetical protein
MEMMDMGKKIDNESQPAVPSSGKKNRISYPGFSISEIIPQELKDAPVGSTCRLEIIVKKTGDTIETYNEGKPRVELEIHKLGYIGKAGKMGKEEYLNASEEDREKNDKENIEEEKEEEEGGDN